VSDCAAACSMLVLCVSLFDFAMHAPSTWKRWRRFMIRRQLNAEHQESRRLWHASRQENRADRRRRAREKVKPRTAWTDFVAIVLRVLNYIDTCCMTYLTGRVCMAILFILARYCWFKEQWHASLLIVLLLCGDDLLLPLFLDWCPTVIIWMQYALYHTAWFLFPYRSYLQSVYDLVRMYWQSVQTFVHAHYWWALCCYLRFLYHADYTTTVVICITILLLDGTRQPFSSNRQLRYMDRTGSTSVLPLITTTVGLIITRRSNTTIHLLFDLSRPVAELLHELGYFRLDVAVLCSHDRVGQYPRQRYTDTLLDYGLKVGINNVITIVSLSSRQRLLGGPQHSTVCRSNQQLVQPTIHCRYAVR
jgi:hypothetical protein